MSPLVAGESGALSTMQVPGRQGLPAPRPKGRSPLRRPRFLPIIACALLAVPASAQLFVNAPDFSGPPVTGAEPGLGLPLPGATPAELRAAVGWNLRAGLNVAALQCQFEPALRTVPNYNEGIAHHSAELATIYTTLGDYFKRVNGAREGQRLFDDYNTKTYNGFSTLYAQLGFCQTGASIGRAVLAAPKGGFGDVARLRLRELRNSLVPAGDRLTYTGAIRTLSTNLTLPPLAAECYDRRDRLRKRCGGRA